jgi:hypothetical protein
MTIQTVTREISTTSSTLEASWGMQKIIPATWKVPSEMPVPKFTSILDKKILGKNSKKKLLNGEPISNKRIFIFHSLILK